MIEKYRDPEKGSECDEIEVHPKDIPKKLKQLPTETMHLMTVSCGRPNYQVKFCPSLWTTDYENNCIFYCLKKALETRK